MKKIHLLCRRAISAESGQVLILVLALLVLGSFLIIPLLDFMGTGLKSGLVHEKKTDEMYAADAGIQDAMWQVKYDHLADLFTNPPYRNYDFNTDWNYNLSGQVNVKDVNVTIRNVWVPMNISVPDEAQASAIIEAQKLIVTSGSVGNICKIKITYYPEAQEELKVENLGVWLPRGFSFVTGSSNLEADPQYPYYAVPTVQSHAGNQALLWTFDSLPFGDLPAEITFQFTSSREDAKPATVSWITTSGVADIPFSWDADTRVFKITSHAGGTTVESYVAKEEMRHLRSSISGDYQASGNSLMIDTNGDSVGIRDQLLSSSDAVFSNIPLDADIGAAFLYWSAWRSESGGGKTTVFTDGCTNFNNWNNGSAWSVYSSSYFRNHYSSGGDDARLLTLKTSKNLSSYAAGTVTVAWKQCITALSDIFSDSCSSLSNWSNGGVWSVYTSGNDCFRGHYSGGDDSTRLLTLGSSQDLSACASGSVQVTWQQSVVAMSDIFSDGCSNFNNWTRSGTSAYNDTGWGTASSSGQTYFRARYAPNPPPGPSGYAYLTLKNALPLGSYAGGNVTISWKQWVSGTPESGDHLYFVFSNDDFVTTSNQYDANIATAPTSRPSSNNYSVTIPGTYLTNTCKVRLYIDGFSSPKYCYVDDITVTPNYSATDGLDFAFSADGGNNWSSNYQAFRGNIGTSLVNFSYNIPSQYLTANFKIRFCLVGCGVSGQYVKVDNIKITPVYDSNDSLKFAFSADGGNNWSNDYQAFSGDIGTSFVYYSYTVPAQYISPNFIFRLYTTGFSGPGEYCNVDNIAIWVMSPDTSIVFKIDGHQVCFDGEGNPVEDEQPLTANRYQVLPNYSSSPNGYSYSCYRDVTDLVRTFSAKAPDPALNHPGNGTYTVGSVNGDTGNEWSYAGWSLIIIYSSAETQGHQLYLYDKFIYADMDGNVDFDNDGQPGGFISGFIVPSQVEGEVDAAKLTVFVGEGDECYTGDYLDFNSVSLSNAMSPANNVWNGKSPGLTADGVDIDTFDITWASGILETGDTSASIDLPTGTDSWNLVYIILSFRSSTTTGGALSYLIR